MNADLTYNSVVFAHAYDVEGRHVRISKARAINTPDTLTIQNAAYVDSKTKVPGIRYNIRFDREDLDPDSRKILSSAYLVIAVPETVTDAQLDVLVATLKAAVANADLIDDVLEGQL
jgi:hypothetical protein